MDERILELLALVQSTVGKVRAYLYPHRRRLKIETSKQMAEEAGLGPWEHELPNGWFNTGISSVFWYVPDGDEDAYRRKAIVLTKL